MAFNTTILQGRFTGTGSDITIPLRSDVDWMEVYNYSQLTQTNDVGLYYKWMRGFPAGVAIAWDGNGGANTVTTGILAAPLGFTLIDTSGNPLRAEVATTASSNATQPVITATSTAGLVTGSIVRYYTPSGSAVRNLGGIDFEVDDIDNGGTNFRIRYALANAPGAVGGAGSYRIIDFDPLFYPRHRFIANITTAVNAVVTTTVQHGYTAGQKIRLKVPAEYSMTEIDGLLATITAVTASTLTLDIDSSSFTTFTWPTNADFAFDFAITVPVGEAAEEPYVNMLDDATDNQGFIGMKLTGGAGSPGGANGDVMYWIAGKSFSVDNN